MLGSAVMCEVCSDVESVVICRVWYIGIYALGGSTSFFTSFNTCHFDEQYLASIKVYLTLLLV